MKSLKQESERMLSSGDVLLDEADSDSIAGQRAYFSVDSGKAYILSLESVRDAPGDEGATERDGVNQRVHKSDVGAILAPFPSVVTIC